jgi:D-sedoheptulose 7-phosphate isomerase
LLVETDQTDAAELPVWPRVANQAARLSQSLSQIDPNRFERVVRLLRATFRADACIFVAGNGGSSATASHWANDLHKTTMGPGRRGVRVLSLTDNAPLLTAFANDEGYESVFRQQLASHLRPGDVVVVISVSGSSPNLVRAIELTTDLGIASIGLLGWDGGKLANMVTEAVIVPAPIGDYPLVESAHALLCDVLCEAITG